VQQQAITPGSNKAKNTNSNSYVSRNSARDSPSMRRVEPVLLRTINDSSQSGRIAGQFSTTIPLDEGAAARSADSEDEKVP